MSILALSFLLPWTKQLVHFHLNNSLHYGQILNQPITCGKIWGVWWTFFNFVMNLLNILWQLWFSTDNTSSN
jgi:hypothetical protein